MMRSIIILLDFALRGHAQLTGDVTSKSGPFKADLQGNIAWPPEASGSVSVEKYVGPTAENKNKKFSWPPETTGKLTAKKKLGPLNAALKSAAVWPLKPDASVGGTFSLPDAVGKLSYELRGTGLAPPEAVGVLTYKKGIGSTGATLRGSVESKLNDKIPVVGGKVGLDKDIGPLSCSLDSPAKWPMQPTASISHTLKDTKVGTICCSLKAPLDLAKTSGTISVKKNLGPVCCKLETKTDGQVQCTFSGKVDKKTWEKPTTPPPPLAWYEKLFKQPKAELFEVFNTDISTLRLALIGLVVGFGGGIFAVLKFYRRASSATEVPLLAA